MEGLGELRASDMKWGQQSDRRFWAASHCGSPSAETVVCKGLSRLGLVMGSVWWGVVVELSRVTYSWGGFMRTPAATLDNVLRIDATKSLVKFQLQSTN